jgi:hypothetical protein
MSMSDIGAFSYRKSEAIREGTWFGTQKAEMKGNERLLLIIPEDHLCTGNYFFGPNISLPGFASTRILFLIN